MLLQRADDRAHRLDVPCQRLSPGRRHRISRFRPQPDDCFLVAATPDGQTIACGDPSVSVRHGAGGAPRVLARHPVRLLAIDDDGTWIAVEAYGTVTTVLAFGPPQVTVTGQLPGVVFGPTIQLQEATPLASVVLGTSPRARLGPLL